MNRRLLLPAAAVLATLAAPAPSRAAISWQPCPEPAFQAFQCATQSVPLDHSGQLPGTVPLFVRRLPRQDGSPADVAIVALSGGPGQAAADAAKEFATTLASGLHTRDLVVFDQRGTGRSGPLACSAINRAGTGPQVVSACARQIGPTRGLYRTADSVADLEALRQAGGYSKLALFAVSYGTKVALDYAARYPSRVERLVLDSVVPPAGPDALLRPSVVAMRRALRELCGAERCRRASPNPLGDVRRLVRRNGARGTYVDHRGRRRRARIDASALYAILQVGDLNPAIRAQFPGAVRAAVRGDEAALLRMATTALGGDGSAMRRLQESDDSSGAALFLATVCEETQFPWAREAGLHDRINQADRALDALSPAAIDPFDASTIASASLLGLCVGWPNAAPAPEPPQPLPAVPALLLSGSADVRTPTEDAAAVAGAIPGSQLLVVPFVGHSVLSGDPSDCGQRAVAGFFTGGPPVQCGDTGPLVEPLDRTPRRLRDVRLSGPVRGRAGRTLIAVLRTRNDVLVQALALRLADARRSGGLRRGTITVSNAGVRMRRVEVVEGVAVSGTFPEQGSVARLRITGRAAARGSLRMTRGGSIRGRLGGRRIDVIAVRSAAARTAGPAWDVGAEAKRLRRLRLRLR